MGGQANSLTKLQTLAFARMKRAADIGIDGRSKMDKGELVDALRNH
jgi:hypothetical protein